MDLPRTSRAAGRFRALTVSLLLAGGFPNIAADLPRIAVLPGSAPLATASDLLSVQLSLRPDLAVVDRAEVNRLLQEQTLLATDGRQVARIGQLLGADGLVFLEVLEPSREPAAPAGSGPTAAPPSPRLLARLVAVRAGVVLAEVNDPWPAPDPARWAEETVGRFAPFLPKLAVLEANAVPISLLNIRHAVAVPGGEIEERTLTSLLTRRLMREKDLFVLERRRMESLTFEQELQGGTSNTFWNGAWLLEGTINPDGATATNTMVRLTLNRTGGASPSLIEAQAARADYGSLVEQLAGGVLEAVAREPEAGVWSAATEAARYAEESRWAQQWRLWPEAIEAAEAAWALGQQDLATAKLRLRPYIWSACPSQTNWVMGVRTQRRPPPPDPRKIALGQRALELFLEGTARFAPNEPMPDLDWYSLGVDDLQAAALIIQAYLYTSSEKARHLEELEDLRQTMRQVVAQYEAVPALADKDWSRPGDHQAIHLKFYETTPSTDRNIHWFKTIYGSLLQDTPAATMAMYRFLFFGPAGKRSRGWFLNRDTNEPIALVPNQADGAETSRLWQEIVRDLVESEDLWQKLHGRLFRLMLAGNAAQMDAAANEVFDLLHASQTAVEEGQLDIDVLTDLEHALKYQQNRPTTAAFSKLQRRFSDFRQEWRTWEREGSRKRIARTGAARVPKPRDVAVVSSNAPALRVESCWVPPMPMEELMRLPGPKPLRPGPGVVAIGRQVPPVPFRKVEEMSLLELGLHGCTVVGNTAWVEYGFVPHYSGLPLAERMGIFFGIDLESGTSQTVRFPPAAENPGGKRTWYEDSFTPQGLQTFDILDGALYLADQGRLWRHDIASGRWEDLGMSLPDGVSVTTVGRRLLLCSRETIAEYRPEVRGTTTLASTRRRPAVSKLDELTFRDVPRPFQAAEGSLGVLVDTTLYGWSEAARDWEVWTNHMNTAQGLRSWFRGTPALWSLKRPDEANLLFASGDTASGDLPQVLLENPPKLWSGITPQQRKQVIVRYRSNPRWTDPQSRRLTDGVLAFADGRLAIILPENPDPNAEVNRDVYGEFRRVVMVLFGEGIEPGSTLVLELHAPRPPWQYRTSAGLFFGIGYLKPVPDGWVLMLRQQPGIWHLKRQQVLDWLAAHPQTPTQ